MITYDDYIERYDEDMDEGEFKALVLNVTAFLKSYCESYISEFKLKDNFDDYGLNIDEAIIQQVHYANQNGGMSVFEGNNEATVKSVSTSGFSYSYDKSNIDSYHGIAIAPLAKIEIMNELRRKKYLRRCVYA